MGIRPSVVCISVSAGAMRCTESFRSENADLRATSAAVAFDTDLRRNLRADLFGVAHHTHLASLPGFEGREGGEHEIERFLVKVAKSFIDEETADVEGVARERSQAQCECEGDNEGLAAREGVDNRCSSSISWSMTSRARVPLRTLS